MLGAIRKFSSSIYAKIFLFIVAIPFVFWGMGPLFRGGNLNTIVKIGNEKISTQEFINFLQYRAPNSSDEALDSNLVEKLLSNFIGEKLISQEIEDFDIKISDDSLRKLIKNEKIFMRDNKFSRIEYEKFLVKNGLNATTLEANISKQKEKEQMIESLKKGDKIITIGGIHGIIAGIKQKGSILVLNLGKNVNITVNRSSIAGLAGKTTDEDTLSEGVNT